MILKERVIVDKAALLKLFRVCSVPACGSVVDPDHVTVHTVGAGMTVTATCLQHQHETTWTSSSTVCEGRKKLFVINILLASYTLFCGLNISQVSSTSLHLAFSFGFDMISFDDSHFQVLELFGHLNIACFSRTFFFKLQSELLHPIVWMSWSYSQVVTKFV